METCVVACQSVVALVPSGCAECLLDESFIEILDPSPECRYSFKDSNDGACTGSCSEQSSLATAVDRRARCQGFCRGDDGREGRCEGADFEDCTQQCLARTDLLTPRCAACVLDEGLVEEFEEQDTCRFFFKIVSSTECASSCSAESSEPVAASQRDARCRQFCQGNGRRLGGCSDADLPACIEACQVGVASRSNACTACVLDNSFFDVEEDGCEYTFRGESDCESFCTP